MPHSYSYNVETYAIFTNVDEGVLKLNSVLRQFGYEFLIMDIVELEKKFSKLFLLPEIFESRGIVLLDDSESSISNEFYEVILHHPMFGVKLLTGKRLIFLKKIEDFKQIVIDNVIDLDKSLMFAVSNEFRIFIDSLVQQFRLLKEGRPDYLFHFQIAQDTRNIVSRHSRSVVKSYNRFQYSLEEADIDRFQGTFSLQLHVNSLTELALYNFNLSYDILEIKAEFITLMTALESLFNQGSDQITHIVSRHLSLLVSGNKAEFNFNYRKIKDLYKLRSAIVHGNMSNKDLVVATAELRAYTRKAINYCLRSPLSKAELFNYLNETGFPV